MIAALSLLLLVSATDPSPDEPAKTTPKDEPPSVTTVFDSIRKTSKGLKVMDDSTSAFIDTCEEMALLQEGRITWYEYRRNGLFGVGAAATAVAGAIGGLAVAYPLLVGTDGGHGVAETVFVASAAGFGAAAGGMFAASAYLYNLDKEEVSAAHKVIEQSQSSARALAAGKKPADVTPCSGALVRTNVTNEEILGAVKKIAEMAADAQKIGHDAAQKATEAVDEAKKATEEAKKSADEAKKSADEAKKSADGTKKP